MWYNKLLAQVPWDLETRGRSFTSGNQVKEQVPGAFVLHFADEDFSPIEGENLFGRGISALSTWGDMFVARFSLWEAESGTSPTLLKGTRVFLPYWEEITAYGEWSDGTNTWKGSLDLSGRASSLLTAALLRLACPAELVAEIYPSGPKAWATIKKTRDEISKLFQIPVERVDG